MYNNNSERRYLSLLNTEEWAKFEEGQRKVKTSIIQKVEKAIKQWRKDNLSDYNIQNTVWDILDNAKNKIVFATLGLEYRFGELEIRRTNGVNSKLAQEIDDAAQRAAADWISKTFPTEVPAPTKAQMQTIRSEYKRRFEEFAQRQVQYVAEHDAETFIAQALDLIAIEDEE